MHACMSTCMYTYDDLAGDQAGWSGVEGKRVHGEGDGVQGGAASEF